MPAHVPPSKPDPDPPVSIDEMLAIRDRVRAQLAAEFHSHKLIARLFRKIGNPTMAQVEEAAATQKKAMFTSLTDPDDTEIHLLESVDN